MHPDHKPVRVNKVVDEYKLKWLDLKEKLAVLVTDAAKIQGNENIVFWMK